MIAKYKIGPSLIHGQGVIATDLLNTGEVIGTAIILTNNGGAVTNHLGKYVNHSINANSKLVASGLNYLLVATAIIYPGNEVVSNYNHAPAFIARPGLGFI